MEKNAEAGDAACEGVTSCSCAPNNLNKAIKSLHLHQAVKAVATNGFTSGEQVTRVKDV